MDWLRKITELKLELESAPSGGGFALSVTIKMSRPYSAVNFIVTSSRLHFAVPHFLTFEALLNVAKIYERNSKVGGGGRWKMSK